MFNKAKTVHTWRDICELKKGDIGINKFSSARNVCWNKGEQNNSERDGRISKTSPEVGGFAKTTTEENIIYVRQLIREDFSLILLELICANAYRLLSVVCSNDYSWTFSLPQNVGMMSSRTVFGWPQKTSYVNRIEVCDFLSWNWVWNGEVYGHRKMKRRPIITRPNKNSRISSGVCST